MRTHWASSILAIYIAVPFILFQSIGMQEGDTEKNHASANVQPKIQEEINGPFNMIVILERKYLDGEISQEVVTETIWSKEDFWAKYDQWELIDMGEDQMVFRKQMDDISPLLKANGYFGITDDGVLTIFNGRPQKMNIIQSFFQIDLGRLESKKCEELKKGIPIKTKDQYVEVLEAFKTYSKSEKQAN
ncbi:intercompartmental signaling factor BofC [Bacillus sp. FJAT-29790]|uniref:intercompartmental signaling factor BofC n=1 Tax=Bacillus sp. FJAT-29790 TaxID=1895002 RepID=UPI001C24547D|nr:intercompartmental signaling factor BofC [Bacillus sp. FJAT-29790]MBU8879534.1 intercompartmental signaling factor BofC [Bacillus sp. FJAT-29790]